MALSIYRRALLRLLRMSNSLWSDKQYVKLQFRFKIGRPLDLNNPVTMNEKLQWLKLYNRHDDLTALVDKIEAKSIIAKRIGQEYIIPTLKVWDKVSDISQEDIDAFPDKFVIKTNHSGGNTGVFICRDKSKTNLEEVKAKMARSLNQDIYKNFREWPYKNVVKRIFAEEYLADDIVDYKFYCFNGKVDSVMMCLDRQGNGPTKFYFFNRDWKLCRYNKAGKAAPEDFSLPKPKGIERMFEIASELSKGHPFVRVDLYNIDGKIYFGETTFYPDAGLDPNRLPESDLYFGNQIDLSLARHETD